MMTTAMSTRPITCIRSTDLDHLAGRASASPRRRSNLNLHTSSDDPVQRLFNALDPDTYVRPHRHARDTGWECLLCVRGAAVALTFDDHGRVTQRIELVADGGTLAINCRPIAGIPCLPCARAPSCWKSNPVPTRLSRSRISRPGRPVTTAPIAPPTSTG